MLKADVQRLGDVPETMLITLWARAVETGRPDAILRDPAAVDLLERIDYDFSRFQGVWMSQVGVAVRSAILDRAVKSFLDRRPDAVIVNLGAGLDTRFHRLGDPRIRLWYDLDLPEAIELRRRLMEETPVNRFIGVSVLDESWMEQIQDDGAPVLILAEGLLMYFSEPVVRQLFRRLAHRFGGGEMFLETLAPFLVGKARHHDSLRKTEGLAEFRWGPADTRVMETWESGLQVVEEWNYFDYHRDRWRHLRWVALLPGFRRMLSNRIVHVTLAKEGPIDGEH